MAVAPREYELVLMLDPGQDAPARDAIAQEARGKIEASGALKHENNWGLRKMAYEIGQSTEADYRWFRFEAPVELLDQLNHSLKITDGVLRFRIFKVDADTPTLAPPTTGAAPAASRERHEGRDRQAPREPVADAAPAAEPAPAADAAAAAEPPADDAAATAEPGVADAAAAAEPGE